MLKKRIIALVTGFALIAAVATASAGVANSLVSSTTPNAQAVACNNSGSAGGGC
jgi:hypothetical protein